MSYKLINFHELYEDLKDYQCKLVELPTGKFTGKGGSINKYLGNAEEALEELESEIDVIIRNVEVKNPSLAQKQLHPLNKKLMKDAQQLVTAFSALASRAKKAE